MIVPQLIVPQLIVPHRDGTYLNAYLNYLKQLEKIQVFKYSSTWMNLNQLEWTWITLKITSKTIKIVFFDYDLPIPCVFMWFFEVFKKIDFLTLITARVATSENRFVDKFRQICCQNVDKWVENVDKTVDIHRKTLEKCKMVIFLMLKCQNITFLRKNRH